MFKFIADRKIKKSAFAVLLTATIFLILFTTTTRESSAGGTITGLVYIDYNMNGTFDSAGVAPNYAIDSGVSGVTVTAFDSSGTAQGTATTGANGTYSLTATGTGPYRLEFTNLQGYSPSAVGTNNATTVRFAADGNSSGNDLGVINNTEYCQNNPDLVTNTYIDGDTANGDVLLEFPYSAGAPMTTTTKAPYENPLSHSIVFSQSQIGTTWGLAYARRTNRLYAASYFKKHTLFGPNGPGAIYVLNPSTNSVVQTITVPNVTTNSHGTVNVCTGTHSAAQCDNGNTGWDAVGKTSLGGIDLSEDETKIYVMNLQNRTLYELDAVSGAALRWQSMPGIPNVTGSVNNLSNSGNLPPGAQAAGDVRPFAVSYLRGKIYVGVISSAESTATTLTNLQAHVYEVDPTTFSFTRRLSVPLNYSRNAVIRTSTNNIPAEWRAWRTTYATVGSLGSEVGNPQPLFTGIEFDNSGNLVMGIRDRAGDQLGHFVPSNPAVNSLLIGDSAGDTIKACGNQASGWVIESNSRCGGQGTGAQNNGEGIGNGEFYNGDNWNDGTYFHDEISLGGLEQLPGHPEITSTVYDPVNLSSGAFSSGARWWNNTQGNATRAYNLFTSPNNQGSPTFGKANGLGDLTALCNPAPLQIGNRVWNDTNGNGRQDPGENGIGNISLQLWEDTNDDNTVDTQVAATTSSANGDYYFSSNNCATTSVTSSISVGTDDAEQTVSNGTVTTGTSLDIVYQGTNAQIVGLRFQNLNIPKDAVITDAKIQFTTNTATSANTVNIRIQGQAVDNAGTFSATTNDLSSRPKTGASVNWDVVPAWGSSGASGSSQQTPNIKSVVQEIVNRSGWTSGNSMAFFISDNATSSNATRSAHSFETGTSAQRPTLTITYITPNSGCYNVRPNTRYEVRLPATNFNSGQPLNAFAPTTPTADKTANGTSRDSNGIVISGSEVFASLQTGDYGQNDHTYDFGFKTSSTAFSIGNRIWFDTNDNGIIDGAEVGISGISVSVFADANSDGQPDDPASPLGTVITDASGYYRFDNLTAGNYVVRVNPSNFNSGGVLRSYANTSGNNTAQVDSSGAASNAENGINPAVRNSVQTNGILSNTFTLNSSSPTAEPDVPMSGSFAGQGSLDNLANVTIDFGFYGICLSGTVWSDTSVGGNNDGLLNNGEAGIPNAAVLLFDSSNVQIPVGLDGILGTADDANGGMLTNASGDYNFCGLAPGTYRVVVNTSGGGTSSTPTQMNADNNVDNDDNGFPDNTGNFPNRIISGLVVLTAGGEPIVNNSNGTTANPTVDFGFVLAPLSVRLEKFDVFSEPDGRVTVRWLTASEENNLGFNVYRETGGKRELINSAPVAGSSLRSAVNLNVSSEGYSWTDNKPVSGAVYYLEDIDMDGTRTLHGPVSPKLQFSSFNRDSNSKLLSDLTNLSDTNSQTESLSERGETERPPVDQKAKERQFKIAAQRGAKIAVKRDGWYRLSPAELASAGFVLNHKTENWQLFADGSEIPMRVGANGAIEFFGRGLDTPSTNTRIYYLVKGESQGLRLPVEMDSGSDQRLNAASFRNTVTRKERAIYFAGIFNGEKENWFGAFVLPGGATNEDLTVFDPSAEGQARLRVSLQGVSRARHHVSVKFNELELGTVYFENYDNEEFEFDVPMSYVAAGNNRIVLRGVGANNSYSVVDSVGLTYERSYKARENRLNFSVQAGHTARIEGFTDRTITLVELNNEKAVRQIAVEGQEVENGFAFDLGAAGYEREFIAVAGNQFDAVASIKPNSSSIWNSSKNKADLVIITPDVLRESAENLAEVRRNQNLKTEVVSVEDIFDEFGFGASSPEAVREFLRHAGEHWQVKPRYVLLFGDSSYDMRNYLEQPDRNLVPTKLIDTQYTETSSDAWLADFDEDGIEDMAIGRLPAGNAAEAEQMVGKIFRYERQSVPAQRSNLFVADGEFNRTVDELRATLPENTASPVIRRSELSNQQTREEIIRQTNDGKTVITYNGHGSTIAWSNGNVFTVNEAALLNNQRLSFYLLMTCLNGYTHNLGSDSLTESLMKAENGAFAVWVSSGVTNIGGQREIGLAATTLLFAEKPHRIGDIARLAKAATRDEDIRRTWQLIGDPTMFVR